MFLNTPSVLFLDREETGPPCSSAMLVGVPISQPGSPSLANSHKNEELEIHLFLFFLSLGEKKKEKHNTC